MQPLVPRGFLINKNKNMSSNFESMNHSERVSRVEIYRMPFPERNRNSAQAKVVYLNQPYADDHAKHGVVFYSRRVKGASGDRFDIFHKRFPHTVRAREQKIEVSNTNKETEGWLVKRKVDGGHEVTTDVHNPHGWKFVPDPVSVNPPI